MRPYRRIGSEELEEGFGGVRELVDGLKESSNRQGSNSRTYNGKLRRKGKGKGSRGNADVSGELNSEGGDVDRKQRGQGNVVRGGENGGVGSNGGLESDRRSSGRYNSRGGGVERRQRGQGGVMRGGESREGRRKGAVRLSGSESEVFDMRLREDGSYEFQ